MDELKEGQDSSDRDSSGEKEATSPATYTEEEKNKAVNDALSSAGRTAKEQEARQQHLDDEDKAAAERRASDRREREEAELEAAADDPQAQKDVRARHKQGARDDELARLRDEKVADKAKLQEQGEALTGRDRKDKANALAAEHKVSAKDLLEFTDGDPVKMEALAKQLPKVGIPNQGLNVDPSVNSGKGGDSQNLTPTQKIQAGIKEGKSKVFQ